MATCIALYRNGVRQGMVVFHNLHHDEQGSWVCTPDGIVTSREVEQILRELRRVPLIAEGRIGEFVWREESSGRVVGRGELAAPPPS